MGRRDRSFSMPAFHQRARLIALNGPTRVRSLPSWLQVPAVLPAVSAGVAEITGGMCVGALAASEGVNERRVGMKKWGGLWRGGEYGCKAVRARKTFCPGANIYSMP